MSIHQRLRRCDAPRRAERSRDVPSHAGWMSLFPLRTYDSSRCATLNWIYCTFLPCRDIRTIVRSIVCSTPPRAAQLLQRLLLVVVPLRERAKHRYRNNHCVIYAITNVRVKRLFAQYIHGTCESAVSRQGKRSEQKRDMDKFPSLVDQQILVSRRWNSRFSVDKIICNALYIISCNSLSLVDASNEVTDLAYQYNISVITERFALF